MPLSNRINYPRTASKDGFSLLQLSLILMVGGLMIAAALPGGDSASTMAKIRITQQRMEKIEAATQAFMAVNQRRPAPASLIADYQGNDYGMEINLAAYPETGMWGAITLNSHFLDGTRREYSYNTSNKLTVAPMSGANGIGRGWVVHPKVASTVDVARDSIWVEGANVYGDQSIYLNKQNAFIANSGTTMLMFLNPLVAGGVPFRDLGLPEEYAIDGFGRRMIYMVDQRVTQTEGCLEIQNNQKTGILALSSDSDFTTNTYDHTMWALMSYGADGQGAMGIQGSELNHSLEEPIKTKRLKTGNTDPSTLSNAFYDASQDTVYSPKGLVNKARTSTFDDIVWVNQTTKNVCAKGTTESYRDFRLPITGTVGMTGQGSVPRSAFGDVNGDGYQDLILTETNSPYSNTSYVTVTFGRKDGWPRTSDITDSADYQPRTQSLDRGFTITDARNDSYKNFGSTLNVGDVNGDGIDDIIIGNSGISAVEDDPAFIVVFGKRTGFRNFSIGSGTPANNMTSDEGITIKQPPAIFGTGILTYARDTSSHYYYDYYRALPSAVGDVNGDGIDDITLAFDSGLGLAQGVIYGKPSGWTDIALNKDFFDGTNGVYFQVIAPDATKGQLSYGNNVNSIYRKMSAVCDVNGDGYKDLLIPGASITTSTSTTPETSLAGRIEDNYVSGLTVRAGSWPLTHIGPSFGGTELAIAVITKSDNNDDITLPSTFTQIANISSDNVRQIIAYRIVHGNYGGGDWVDDDFTALTNSKMSVALIKVIGADIYHPIDIVDTFTTGSGTATSFELPSVDAPRDNNIVLYTLGSDFIERATLGSTPAGTTKLEEYRKDYTTYYQYYNQTAVYYKYQASAGDTGTGTYTTTNVTYPAAAAASAVGATIVIHGAKEYAQRMYIKEGQSSNWTNTDGLIDPSTGPMLKFGESNFSADIKTVACKDINSDGYDDVLMYMKNRLSDQEYIYSYMGRSTITTTDMATDYDLRLDLTSGAPSRAKTDPDHIPFINFGDLNNDGRKDIIISRPAASYGTTWSLNPPYADFPTLNGSTYGYHEFSNSGAAYVLFQPEYWGTMPRLRKALFSYNLKGSDGMTIYGIGPSNLTYYYPASSYMTINSDAADMNKDGIDDLLISGYGGNNYFVFGKKNMPGQYFIGCNYSLSFDVTCAGQVNTR